MTKQPETVDLESLFAQIFSGVYPVHGAAIINARKALLYTEATKAMYAAGYDNARIAAEMSRLDEIVTAHFDSTETAVEQPTQTRATDSSASTAEAQPTDHRPTEAQPEAPSQANTSAAGSPDSSNPDNGDASKTADTSPPSPPWWKAALPVAGWSFLALIGLLTALLWYEGAFSKQPLTFTTISVEYMFTKDGHPGFFPSKDGYEKVQTWCDTPDERRFLFGLLKWESSAPSEKGRIILKTANSERGYLWSCTHNEELPFEEEYHRAVAAQWAQVKAQMLQRVGEFGYDYPCEIAIKSAPYYGKDELYERHMEAIASWLDNEQDRLHTCIRATRISLLEQISPFLNNLFEQEVQKHTPAIMVADVVTAYSADAQIEEAYQNLQQTVFKAETGQYAENTRQWNRYAEKKIAPARKNGLYWERKWDAELAKEAADKAFKEKHGVGPDDYCQYEDRRGRTYKKRCSEAVKDPNWSDLGDGGFSQTMRAIGQMADEMSEQMARQSRQGTANYPILDPLSPLPLNLTLTMNQSFGAYGLYGGGYAVSDAPGVASGGSLAGGGCNETMDFGTFEPCFFPEPDCSLKTKGIFGSCRDYAKEKACQAEQKKKGIARQRERVADLKQRPECTKRAHCLEADLDGRKPDECKPGTASKSK